MILADQIKDLEQRSGALERCLNIEQKRIDLLNEEEKTQVPDFWDNPDQAREQLRRRFPVHIPPLDPLFLIDDLCDLRFHLCPQRIIAANVVKLTI